MKKNCYSLVLSVVFFLLTGCQKEEDLTPPVETAMKVFASWLQNDLPTTSTVSDRVRLYINGQPDYFFGSTVTLLDINGIATTSPYWYRKNGVLVTKELATPSYNINTQDWLRKPIDTKASYWSAPYFDSGGGDIWMRTYSVPIIINNKVVAVATTDLAVKKP
jgi:sigma-B regulation protein RsbU (phosphoserine phosphatase)